MTPKPTLIYDLEVYKNYFLAGWLNIETGNVRYFEATGEDDNLTSDDISTILKILEAYRVVGFNSNNYDLPILGAALKGATCAQLKAFSDRIIGEGRKPWQIGLEPPRADHVDLFEVAPGMASLKIYGGRLHCKKMQDLPIHEAASITPEQRPLLRTYNANDLTTTGDLWRHLQPQLDLREQMSKVYGIDLRSKSDAQIAEAVIVSLCEKALGERIQRPEIPGGTRFPYKAPAFVKFESPELRETLSLIESAEFLVPDGGNVQMPDVLKKRVVKIGKGAYRMGIGGLHSSEASVSHYADDTFFLKDVDVTSYYPNLILNAGLYPPSTGRIFTEKYRMIVDQRIAAKRRGDKTTADSLKTTVVSTFGKLGSKWSKFFAPQLMIQVTITGQLSLLMLIERVEAAGIMVVSANTDGVTMKPRRDQTEHLNDIVTQWEKDTGFETEETLYTSLHSHAVNSYFAFKADGVKLKGDYAVAGLQKNPTNEICIEAVIAFLKDDVPIEHTIKSCTDIRKFVTIRQVNGGAIDQSGAYLGKAVRWYYAKGVEGPLRYSINGYTVARSEGARACMELPDALPADVDVGWYCRESESILADLGVNKAAYAVRELV